MTNQAWFHRAVVYQVYPRSFADSNGDGIGDLRGITERLDYLAHLGVDVLWLSPVYRSPQDDNGYDISDYQDIDPIFGTLADLDELTEQLHRRDMKLMMDLVINHSSDEHRWFMESRASRHDAKRDWYWWRPPRPGTRGGQAGAEPNNWGSFFGGSAWAWDEHTGDYYLHLFSRKQPDLNWENPQVRQALYAMMRWWLDRGVDGFRMDVINLISKDPSLPDGMVAAGHLFGDITPHTVGGPRNHEFLQEMHREVLAGRDRPVLTVGETPRVRLEEAQLFTDPERRELDMVFQFEHVEIDHDGSKWKTTPFDLLALKRTMLRWQEGLATCGWNSLYWNNHDQPRVVSRYGDDGAYRVDSAKVLGTILHLHRGTPYIYQGEELGMTNAPFASAEDFQDIESLDRHRRAMQAGGDHDLSLAGLRAMSRDNARTPMQWDSSATGGFTSGQPWLAVNPNTATINAADAQADPASVLHHYRRLIALRHQEPAVAEGDYHQLLAEDPALFVFTRRFEGTELLVLGNFSAEPRAVALPAVDAGAWAEAEVLLDSGPPAPASVDSSGDSRRVAPLVLGPWASRVYRRGGGGALRLTPG